MIGTRLSHYEVRSHLGSGGMGAVWRAKDTKLGRDVAIKTLPDEFARDADRLARFEREAKLLASLNHPNIATIHGLEEHQGQRFLVLELIEGDSLADRLLDGPLPLEESLKLVLQVAGALEAAHERGVIHRDLKPANIKVTPDGVVKVLDFGLAKTASTVGADDSITASMDATEAGVILGTVAYMAPEQASGKVVDKRADIWAFGVLLYEILTGERPFRGADGRETLTQVLTKEPDLERVPAAARRLVAKCLEKDPKRRLRDIGDAWELLDRTEPQGVASPAAPRLTLILAVVVTVLLVALSALSFLYFGQQAEPDRLLRSALPVPEGATSVHSFAVSPDGRTVVIAAVVNGKRQLWLRPMDTLQAQVLPNTEEATYPFWSPSGRHIGFFAQGSLKKIAADGGPSEPLCPVPDSRGGSWGRGDVIVFSTSLGGRNWIRRLPASGGVPEDVSGTNGDYTNPTFLPDGDHFLFVNRSQEAGGIYVSSVDGKESRRVLSDVSAAVYAPPSHPRGERVGHLLFVRDNALMAQPFDAGSAQLLGEASVLARGVSLTANQIYAPVSVSETGVLLYQSAVTAGSDNLIYLYDRSGKPQQAIGLPGDELPRFSRDEKFVLFHRLRSSALYLRDLNRGLDRVLVRDETRRGAPVFSPASDRIAFGIREEGIFNLYQRMLGASAQDELLVKSSYSKAPTQWSNRFLVYQEFNPVTKRDIWVLPMDEGAGQMPRLFLQTKADELFGQLSPDGRWMAYTSDVSGRLEVYVRAFADGSEALISAAGGQQPRWSRDSKELFFEGGGGKLTVVRVSSEGASFKAGPPQPLFDMRMARTENGAQFQYDVTADGQRFVIATSGAESASARPLTLILNWQAGLPK